MQILYFIIRIYEIILIIRILMSWFRPDPSHPFVRWIYNLTEPVLDPLRRLLPIHAMGIDFSPIIVFILIGLLKRVLFGTVLF